MKLRKVRKAPKRYDDFDWHAEDHGEDDATTPSPHALARPASRLRPCNLPFNPNLPPAAFPTLDVNSPRKANPPTVASPPAPDPTFLVWNTTKVRGPIDWVGDSSPELQQGSQATKPTPPPYQTPRDIEPGSMYDILCRMRTQ